MSLDTQELISKKIPHPSESSPSHESVMDQFIESIKQTNGTIIPLTGRKSRLGEQFFISARFGKDIHPQDDTKYCIVDVFVQRNGNWIPIGIRDYEIKKNIALSNKQRHQHLPASHPAHQAADRHWSTNEALHVRQTDWITHASRGENYLHKMNSLREKGIITDKTKLDEPIYHRQGLGSLMTAVSLLVLKEKGIDTIRFGSLTPPAIKVWKNFGRKGNQMTLNVSQAASHENIINSIKPFL